MALAVGDVVRLVSGGPDMTVEIPDDGGLVACCWFDDKHLHRDRFDEVALQRPDGRLKYVSPDQILWVG